MSGASRRSSATRPNFFIGIPIDDEEIVSNVKKVQKDMTHIGDLNWHGLQSTKIFRDALVPRQKLHLTINVLRLEGEIEIQMARLILSEACKWIKQEFGQDEMTISFKGIGSFGGYFPTVLFANVAEESEVTFLTALHEHIKGKFQEEMGISMESSMPFHPHLTIAKIAGSRELANKRIRSFHPSLTRGLENTNFGVQNLYRIQLLRMGSEDPITGQYISTGNFSLHSAPPQQNSSAFFAMFFMFLFLVWCLVRCCI